MGIQGLLPLLKDIQVKKSISTYSGQTVGIDGYCWLHKAGYSCAKDLALGKPTKAYVGYVIRRLNMMISHKVTPIVVFDGGNLPAKAETNRLRRVSKKKYRDKAMAALKDGNNKEAHDNFQKCIDVTPEMANEVIAECYSLNVQCIVAPYEADAQLAYMMKEGITNLTISEDSDLLIYGCNKVMYKMTPDGEGLVIDTDDLANVRSIQLSSFTLEKFRHLCMLSGCDYLPSIKGMGLIKSYKALRRFSNVYQCIKSLKCDRTYSVPKDYEENFRMADLVFKYQLVFDIRTKTVTRLTDINELDKFGDVEKKFAGPKLTDNLGLQIALGNIDPITGKQMSERIDFASGDITGKIVPKSNSWDSPPVIPNTNTAFQFQNSQNKTNSQNETNFHNKKNNQNQIVNQGEFDNKIAVDDYSLPDPVTKPRTSLEQKPNSHLAPNKSLKRLLDEEEPAPTRDDKIQKLYKDDVVDEYVSKEETIISPPKEKKPKLVSNHQNVFSKKHNKLNPFRSTLKPSVSNKPNEKVVSRFFDTRVIKAKENSTILQVDTPELVSDSDTEEARSSKMDGSFIDYLDKTNLRGYEVKKLTLSPENKEERPKKPSPKSVNKRLNMFSLFKKENDNLCTEEVKIKPPEPQPSENENVDFNVTIPIDSDFKNEKKNRLNMFKNFSYVNKNEKVNVDDDHNDDCRTNDCGVDSDMELEIVEKKVDSKMTNLKASDNSMKKMTLKLGLSKGKSKGSISSWMSASKASKSEENELDNDEESESGNEKVIENKDGISEESCEESICSENELSSTESNFKDPVSEISDCVDIIPDIFQTEKESVKNTETIDSTDIASDFEEAEIDKKEISSEENCSIPDDEDPLPPHLRNLNKLGDSKKDNKKKESIEVIFLDDEEPLPFNIVKDKNNLKEMKSDYFKKKPIPSKLPVGKSKCKPIGLQRKKSNSNINNSNDKTRQTTFEKFAFKKKSTSSDDAVCLS